MLVTFKSSATDSVTMFGEVATQLIRMMGGTGRIPGAFNAEDVPAALQQQRFSPIAKGAVTGHHVDWMRVAIVAFILIAAIVTNVVMNVGSSEYSDHFPFLGAAVWVAIVLCVPVRRPEWSLLPGAFRGSMFLLSLVTIASMMPVEKLPSASWQSSLALGFISSVFDNIPLTALALKQGGYDWGMLAYAVGFGGSMIWFGSSAGVALATMYPEARSVGTWLRHGWHIALAYVIGFFALLWILGWDPHEPHKTKAAAQAPSEASTGW